LLKPHQNIDFSRIHNKEVESFIHDNNLLQLSDFADLESYSRHNPEIQGFHHHSKTFTIQKPLNEVWDAYKNIHPKLAWNGKMLKFGLQYCRKKNEISYMDDEYAGASAGQIVLICVKVLNGLAKVAVGHEITGVNEKEKTIETSYLLKGKSLGCQQIQLKQCPKGFTEIKHHTLYKSGNWFRDKFIYPFFHTKAIKEFHSNIRRHLQ